MDSAQAHVRLSLHLPLERNYSNLVNFSKESIDLFYDLVECCYQHAFIHNINPISRYPYLTNARIAYVNFKPTMETNLDSESSGSDAEDRYEADLCRFSFHIAYDIMQTIPNTRIVPCVLKIILEYSASDYKFKPLVYTTLKSRKYNPMDQYFYCLNIDIYNNISSSPYICTPIKEEYVFLFKIWLTISKQNKDFKHMDAEYFCKYNKFFRILQCDTHRFDAFLFSAFANIMIPRLAPSHDERPYLTEALSQLPVLAMIQHQGSSRSIPFDMMERIFYIDNCD
jgi:hypothetical protein